MLALHPTRDQAAAIVQALHAVATAQGTVALVPIERDSIVEIQRHLLHLEQPIEPAGATLPDNLAETVEPAMRQAVVRILALLPLIDKRILPAKIAVVEEAARRLRIDDRALEILRLAARGKFRSIGFSTMMRSVAHFWSPTGKMRIRDWLDMLRNFLPPMPGIYQMIGDRALLARFRALEQLPRDTLGYALYRFYADRSFAMPGAPKSFPEGWTKHETYHVLSEYEVTNQGEMLLAALIGGNSRLIGIDLLMVTLLQFQAGKRVVPGPTPVDELRPAAFFRAIARGSAMTVDLLDGRWNLWPVAEQPIAAVRVAYGVPPLSAQERDELKGWQALIPTLT